jgi:UDP:flavonoid glycosyltransferase YjiC (YdhE family)
MTHFGIICPGSTGPLNTMLPLGQELQRRGHRVTLFGLPDTEKKSLTAGVEFQAVGTEEFPVGWAEKSFWSIVADCLDGSGGGRSVEKVKRF